MKARITNRQGIERNQMRSRQQRLTAEVTGNKFRALRLIADVKLIVGKGIGLVGSHPDAVVA